MAREMRNIVFSGVWECLGIVSPDRRCAAATILNFRDRINRFLESGTGCRRCIIPSVTKNDGSYTISGSMRRSDERGFHVDRFPRARYVDLLR